MAAQTVRHMSDHTKGIPLELAREIARQGEARLNAVMALSTAAVARATMLCGIFGAASIGLVAAVLAYVGTAPHPAAELVWAGATTASLLFLAAVLAACAGAPRNFWLPGGMPRALRERAWDEGRWRSESELLDATAAGQAAAIDADRALIERESLIVRGSLWLALASMPIGIATYFVAMRFA